METGDITGCSDCGVVKVGRGRQLVRPTTFPVSAPGPVAEDQAPLVLPASGLSTGNVHRGPSAVRRKGETHRPWRCLGDRRAGPTGHLSLDPAPSARCVLAHDLRRPPDRRQPAHQGSGPVEGCGCLGVNEHVQSHNRPPTPALSPGLWTTHAASAESFTARLLELVPERSGKAALRVWW